MTTKLIPESPIEILRRRNTEYWFWNIRTHYLCKGVWMSTISGMRDLYVIFRIIPYRYRIFSVIECILWLINRFIGRTSLSIPPSRYYLTNCYGTTRNLMYAAYVKSAVQWNGINSSSGVVVSGGDSRRYVSQWKRN